MEKSGPPLSNEELESLLLASNRRSAYLNQLEHLKQKFREACIIAWDGHLIDAGHAVQHINVPTENDGLYIHTCPVIVLDVNDEPVLIPDTGDRSPNQLHPFWQLARDTYRVALMDYHEAYTKLQAARNTEDIIGLE